MSSILTNMSAMSAVANLAATQKSLASVQNEISTGLKVASATDNAAYFSIATGMRTTTGQLSSVSDSLNLGTSIIGAATAAYNSTLSILQKMSQDLVSAAQSGVDKVQIQTDITSLQSQLSTAANSASFNNVNLLSWNASTDTATASIVSSVTGAGSNFTVNTIGIDRNKTALVDNATGGAAGILSANGANYTTKSVLNFDISGFTDSAADATKLADITKDVALAISAVTSANSQLGATQNNINLQSTFVGQLSNAITTGVGSLVDADMNEASTRLNALQTQQQLGVQSLSIANQNSQLILKLFQ